MPRGLNALQRFEARRDGTAPALFVEVILAASTVRFWTGVGTATLNGATWQGCGEFISIEGIESSLSRNSGGIRISLNGVPTQRVTPGVINSTLGLTYQGRKVNIYLGFCDEQGSPKPDVGLVRLWTGYADSISYIIGETISATLECEHFASRLARPNGLRMTSESHNARLGNPASKDLFFEPQNRLMVRARASAT